MLRITAISVAGGFCNKIEGQTWRQPRQWGCEYAKMANNTIETRRPDKRSANAEAARREPRARLEGAPVRGRPANENDPGSSIMLAKLRRRPSYVPYYAAFLLSLIWIAGWFFTF